MAQHENDDDDVCPNSLVDSSDDEEDYDNGDSNVKSQSQHSSAYTTATKFSKRKGDRKPLQSIDPNTIRKFPQALEPTPNTEQKADTRPSSFVWDGYKWVIKNKRLGKRQGYSCSNHRPSKKCPDGCKATLSWGWEQDDITTKGEHTCCANGTIRTAEAGEAFDARAEMTEECSKRATEQLTKTAKVIALEMVAEFREKYAKMAVKISDLNALESLVHRERRKYHKHDMDVIMEHPVASIKDNDTRRFVKFNAKIDSPYTGETHTFIGFANPDLLLIPKHGFAMPHYIDCTYKSCPHGFVQCLIIMVYSQATGMYVPIWYILLDGASEWVYTTALRLAQIHCGPQGDMKASTVTTDFEKGLINAVKTVFPNAEIVGCLFHFFQALMRYWKDECRLPKNLGSLMCYISRLLTVVDPEEIDKAIAYCRAKINEDLYPGFTQQFNKYWAYFIKTWVKEYKPKVWNVHRFVCRIETLNEKDYLELKNKSNNGLERENKEMNKIFPKKPTLLGFVSGIKERSCEFVNMNELISKGLGSRPPHQTPKVFPIPDDYVNGPIVPYQMVKDGVKYTPLVGAVTADA